MDASACCSTRRSRRTPTGPWGRLSGREASSKTRRAGRTTGRPTGPVPGGRVRTDPLPAAGRAPVAASSARGEDGGEVGGCGEVEGGGTVEGGGEGEGGGPSPAKARLSRRSMVAIAPWWLRTDCSSDAEPRRAR